MSEYGRPNRAIASSPTLAPRRTPQPQHSPDTSVRQMRLKVLYTFDEDKTNCLARWPHTLDIRTVFLSADTQVGIIELKTCLQAIATASPEIVTGLGQDYTVYAYDYSEYETPLVGQGMLSWILASASPTPGAPAQQSRTMVTGRVSQNALSIFTGGSQETLEVKLRLVPVPTSKQSEYLESMKKYRDISQAMPPGFDPQAWTSFLNHNPNFLQQTMQSRSQSPSTAQQNTFGIENVQRLLSGDYEQSAQARRLLSRSNSFANAEAGQQLPRLPSPASSVTSTTVAPKRRGRKPGPNYKGPKTRRGKKEPPPESTDPGYCTGDDRPDEGPNKKRARVVQAEWDGKPELGKQPDSLRVAASTAASVRIHQPTAVRPDSHPHLSLDNQPRAPTPVADPSQIIKKPRMPVSRSNLGQLSQLIATPSNEALSPAVISDKAPELSPEKSQAESSPADIASSPPVFPEDLTTHSSPQLPEFPRAFDDSGIFTGSLDNLFDDQELRSLDEEDFAVAAQYSKRLDLPVDNYDFVQGDGTMSELPQIQFEQSLQGSEETLSSHSNPESRLLNRTVSSSELPPPIPASDPIRPCTLHRSQTWAGKHAAHPASDTGQSQPADNRMDRTTPRGRGRRQSDTGGQSGVRKKATIQSKLATSVAAGEIPPFCDNCGAIETPAWRKAWSKIHSGTPEHVRLSNQESGVLAWQTLQTDKKGEICLFRIIKKSLAEEDEGFTEMLLCNPCGMFLTTKKCMRPKEMWDKSQKGPDDKEKGRRRSTGPRPASSGQSTKAASGTFSDPSSPTSAPKQVDALENEPKLPAMKWGVDSHDKTTPSNPCGTMDEASATAALKKAIRSSPHKFNGTEQEPIEVENLTPQPTRRILFPSPHQSEKAKSKQRSPTSAVENTSKKDSLEELNEPISRSANKENYPPSTEDDIDRFFNEDGYGPPAHLSTPTGSRSKYPFLNRTPSKSPSKPSSSGGKSLDRERLLPPSTPKRTPTKTSGVFPELTPFTAHLSQLLSDANAGSPGGNFSFPPLPSLRNTPNNAHLADFDFGHFDSQDLISTDVPMPSSPPPWNFGDFSGEGNDSLWGDCTLPNTIASPDGSDKHQVHSTAKSTSAITQMGPPTLQNESAA
ncbi:uncharacterized protein KY384_004916 [Bacidia gigantensis]|uniref:uncharacterized protein n=1 Tax=Bacidia gigantensis TaxID=2732470 RepID=UPI001D03C3AF|nr:uncharacterized protein KY384_004916 [Bacidia gigantensis]KAG8530414.1 hypothetical protein KY384_004916 [Bacidia gigantensis]